MGRPAEFKHRVRLQVFIERTEFSTVKLAARDLGVSVSAFARRAILTAVAAHREGAGNER
jgi:hypothetical protein